MLLKVAGRLGFLLYSKPVHFSSKRVQRCSTWCHTLRIQVFPVLLPCSVGGGFLSLGDQTKQGGVQKCSLASCIIGWLLAKLQAAGACLQPLLPRLGGARGQASVAQSESQGTAVAARELIRVSYADGLAHRCPFSVSPIQRRVCSSARGAAGRPRPLRCAGQWERAGPAHQAKRREGARLFISSRLPSS